MHFERINIDAGRTVVCDFCGVDYTDSDERGGLLFVTRAVCPRCVPKLEADAAIFCEEHLIRARCPPSQSFADWVRESLRGNKELRT